VENALRRGVVSKYSLTPGLPELRELIEYSLERENMYYDWQKEILVTAGAIEAITATILTLTREGDEIIIPEPTYTSYKEVIKLAGCKPVFVPLDENKNWAFDFDKFRQAVTNKTKAIFYCNPNNPTGTIYTKEQLLQLADLAQKNGLYIISDEVYKDFIFDKTKIFSLAEIKELRKSVIRIFSFSKVFAMTGWRVGYLHSDESIVREIIKVHDSLVTCAPVISQYAAMGALEMRDIDFKGFIDKYKNKRDLTSQRLQKLSSVFDFVIPQGAYYAFPKIMPAIDPNNKLKILNKRGEVDSWKFVMWLLKETQVATVPGVAFGETGEGHIRINFGRSEESINEAFDRIENALKNKCDLII
jgi:aminotransferase